MRSILCAALLFASAPAFAADDMIFEGADFSVRIVDKPCTSVVVAALLAQVTDTPPRHAVLAHGSDVIVSCWIAVPERGAVLVAGEDGKGAALPMAGFKRVPGL